MWKFIIIAALLALALPAKAASNLFDYGASWKYKIGTAEASNPVAAWRAADFDDTSWQSGASPIGYATSPNNGYEEAIVTSLPTSAEANYLSVFLRKSFNLSNPATVRELTLNVAVDDGFVAWVNGNFIGLYNVGDQNVSYNSSAVSALEPSVQTVILTGSMADILRTGKNVIAVQLFNANLGSSDLVFDAVLSTDLDEQAPVIAEVTPAPGSRVREFTVIDISFSEPVIGIQASDLLVNGSPAQSMQTVSPLNFTFSFNQPADGTVNVAWAANHGITDTAVVPNAFQAGGPWSYTADSSAPVAKVVISEFMASNENGIRDNDGNRSDWLEIFNTSNISVNLAGWFLTDDTNTLAKWKLPGVNLGAGNYLLVWASGKNRAVAGLPLHTDFKLGKSAGFLALVDPNTNIVSFFGASYPAQRDDISFGRDVVDSSITGYFSSPTPGARNLSIGSGFAPDPQFSRESGVYTNASFTVSITAPSGQIRYTLNGTVPTATSTLYTAPITVNGSASIKARVFQTGLLPSEVIGRVFTMVDNTSANFSSTLPLMVFNTGGQGIVGEVQPGGIRTFSSVAIIDTYRGRAATKGEPDYLGFCELEGRGQTSSGFPKRPYNMEIQNVYRFDEKTEILDFPAGSDFALINPYSDKPFLQNFLAYELYEKMGNYAVRRRFVEVFVNTSAGKVNYARDYAGIYLLVEKIRVDDDRVDIAKLAPGMNSEPEISGGYIFKKDKDSAGDLNFSTSGGAGFSGQNLKIHEPKPREITTQQLNWLRSYLNRMEQSMYAANWKTATGTNHYSHYLDVDSFVDYHWIVEFPKQIDGYRLSNYMNKDRNGKVKFEPIWDWNLSFGNANYLTGESASGWYYTQIGDADHIWLRRLISGTADPNGTTGDPDFNQKIADRWSVLRTNIMNEQVLLARIDQMAALLSEPAGRDFARYPRLGQYIWPNPDFYVTPTTYAGIISALKTWVSGRYRWVDSQFIKPPVVSAAGGYVAPGASVTLTGTGGTIYFTRDGTDPRLPGGGLSSKAQAISGPIVISASAKIVARIRNGPKWSGPAAASFTTARPALAVSEMMYHPALPPAGSIYTDEDFEFIELKNTGGTAIELGGFKFTEGVEFTFPPGRLQAGERVLLVKNRVAFESRYGANSTIAGEFTGSLDNAGERMVLFGSLGEPVIDFEYKDAWLAVTDGPGFSLVLQNENGSAAFWNSKEGWTASAILGGSPGAGETGAPTIPRVVVNEVSANPEPSQQEKVELLNLENFPADLSGWWLTDNREMPRKYRLPAGSIIQPKGFLVILESAFSGAFNLSSLGEEIYLFSGDANGNLTGYMDGFEFDATPIEFAIGRYVTETGKAVYLNEVRDTFGAPNGSAISARAVVSEIMYHPADLFVNNAFWNNTEDEYIEIWNSNVSPVSLFDPERPANTWKITGDIDFTFPQNVTIAPMSGLLVVSFDPALNPAALAAFRNKYNVAASVPVHGPYAGSLPNSGGTISLREPLIPVATGENAGTVPYMAIEKIKYLDGGSWPAGADGLGRSLTRVQFRDPWYNGSNWAAAPPSPGTDRAVLPGPVISQQPAGAFAKPGAPVTLSVSASGTGLLGYQWRRNGVNLPGATGSTLVLNNSTPAQSGEYQVVVSDSAASTTSSSGYVQISNDSDDDKILDDWEIASGGNPFSAADASLDDDGDGFSNVAEFYAGTDPRNADSLLAMGAIFKQGDTVSVAFGAPAKRSFVVEFKGSLSAGAWTAIAFVNGQTEATQAVINHVTAGEQQGYYRIVAAVQP